MKLCKPLYLSPSIKNPRKLLHGLKSSKKAGFFYVLTISNSTDQLDIYPACVLKQPVYRKISPIIVGLASNRQEAFDLILRITEDSLAKTSHYNLKSYLLNRRG